MFQANDVEKIKAHVSYSITFPRKIVPFKRYGEKYGTARQVTDDKIRRMRFACWVTKTTGTYSEYVILIAFPLQQWLTESALMLL